MTASIAKTSVTADWAGNIPYLAIVILVMMALYGIFTNRNLIKIVISLSVLDSAVNMFLVMLGYRHGGGIPIYYLKGNYETMVLPTPQAFTLTAIVIALATTAFLLSLVIIIHKHYGTMDIDEIRRLRG